MVRQTISRVTNRLLKDVRGLIESAKNQVAQFVNSELVMLNWNIGKRISKDVLAHKRAEYGKEIVATVSQQLTREYGQGFTRFALTRMIKFAERFPDSRVVATLSQQLGWSHFVEVIHLDDSLKRDFYTEMCRIKRWSVRTLRNKIKGMLYERTAISKRPGKLMKQELKKLRTEDQLSPDLVFKDPYFLDFLGLKGSYSEKDVELAILRELEQFLIEFGTDFSFVARQKRMTVGSTDYYLDLLFYHRGLKRLVAIELKLDKFQAAYKGQMELYLRWLDKYEKRKGEKAPLGLILCSEKNHEEVALLKLDRGHIRVSQYLTQLPSRKLLEKKLHEAMRIAQKRLNPKS